MAASKPYILGGEAFRTDVNDNVATVQRLPVIPASQSVIDSATSTGNLNVDGSINYVKVDVNGNVRGNYEQLAAPDGWMEKLSNDPSYFSTINQSIGGENPNLGTDETLQFGGGVLETNENPNQSPTASNAGGDLRYPLNNDGSYDFLLITTYKYVNAGPGAAGRLLSDRGFDVGDVDSRLTRSEGPTIALPMHPGISDSNSVDWGADQLNPLQLVGARGASAIMDKASSGKFGEAAADFFNVLKTAAGAAMNDIDATDITAFFAGQAVGANIFTRSTGKVINPNLELLFRGPQLRTFNYNYKFTPRSDAEAKTIRSIIRHFKKNMAVKKSNGKLFLETPNVFGLKYIYAGGDQHPFLNKIKKCALTNFNVDYTPDGSYTTYKDGSMTSYSVTMQFSELNPIYEEDYKESNDMGY